jgi:hypothetical protein
MDTCTTWLGNDVEQCGEFRTIHGLYLQLEQNLHRRSTWGASLIGLYPWMQVSRVYFAECEEMQDAHTFCPSEVSSHFAVCITTGPQSPPKPTLQTVRSSASSVNLQYPVVSWRTSNSCLHILQLLTVTSNFLSVFPSIQCYRRQFPRNTWPIHTSFIHYTICRIILSSLSLPNIFSFLTRTVQMIFRSLLQPQFKNISRNSNLFSEVSKLQHHTNLRSKCSVFPVSPQI